MLSQNIKIERCILILGINIEPDDLADLRKSINRLDVYCAASGSFDIDTMEESETFEI